MASFTIGTVKVRVGADTATLSRDLDKAKRQLQRSASELQSIGTSLTQKISFPIAAFGGISLKVAGDIEALQKGLISVSGTAEAAGKEFEKLREVAKLPGLGLQEAIQGSVALQAAGFSADEARASLLAFGNALATVGKGKNELSLVQLALTQLQNKTTGFGQEIRQLTEQLPQLRGALVNAFGTAESEKIAKLGVTGKEVVQILTQEFAKLPQVAGGLKNSFENAGDAIKLALFKVGEAINRNFNIEGLITKISDKITALADAFGNLSPTAQKTILALAGVAAAIGPVIFVIGKLQAGIAVVTGLFSSMAAGGLLTGSKIILALNPVSATILAVGAAIALTIIYWDDLKAAIADLNATSQTFRDVMGAIKLVLNQVGNVIVLVIDGIKALAKSWLNVIGVFSGDISPIQAFRNIQSEFATVGKNFGQNVITGFKDAAVAENLSRLTAITGLQSPSGNRADSFKKLNEQKGKAVTTPNIPTKSFAGEAAKVVKEKRPDINFTELISVSEANKQFNQIAQAFEDSDIFQGLKRQAGDFETKLKTDVLNKLPKIEIKPLLSTENIINGLEETKGLLVDFTNTVQSSAVGAFTALGESIGNIFSGQGTVGDLFNNMLAVIADFGKKLGQQIIAVGVAGLALKKVFANPFAAIAAGTALVILSTIASNSLKKGPSLAIGTDYVKSDGFAQIHKGEAIVPAKVVEGGFKGNGVSNSNIKIYGTLSGQDIILSNRYGIDSANRYR